MINLVFSKGEVLLLLTILSLHVNCEGLEVKCQVLPTCYTSIATGKIHIEAVKNKTRKKNLLWFNMVTLIKATKYHIRGECHPLSISSIGSAGQFGESALQRGTCLVGAAYRLRRYLFVLSGLLLEPFPRYCMTRQK